METLVLNDACTANLATVNAALRHVRTRCALPKLVSIDSQAKPPKITLAGPAPDLIMSAAKGLYSHRVGATFEVRCTAFGVDWIWHSEQAAVHFSRAMAMASNLRPVVGSPYLQLVERG